MTDDHMFYGKSVEPSEGVRPVYVGMALDDFSKVDRSNGVIRYKLYQQDGRFQAMTCPDTFENCLFVSWVQKFDRYTVRP